MPRTASDRYRKRFSAPGEHLKFMTESKIAASCAWPTSIILPTVYWNTGILSR